jgi:ATP-dependent protease ClpP protease subunit
MSEEVGNKPNRIMVNQHVVNEYRLRLARAITEPDDFEEEFQLFAAAGERDVINIEITSPGGSLDTGHLICRAITSTAAHTVAYIGPTCASAATAIALACDEWEIDEMSSFMVHTASYGYAGIAPHVKANVDHNDKMIARFVRSTYAGFLSEEEIERVIDGKELYFEGDELADRLTAFSEYREALREAYAKESEEGLDTPDFVK